jgi:hypothetical protein
MIAIRKFQNLEGNVRLLSATLMLASACLNAQEGGRTCNTDTLRGDYAFTVSGTRPTGPSGPLEQFLGWALVTFDGDGGGTQIGASHGSINGDSIDDSGTLTYSLNPDCTGTATLQLSNNRPLLSLWMVVMDDAKEVRFVVRAPLASPPGPASNQTISIGRKVWSSRN